MRPRTIFLTGASSGIGRALALEYARRGAHVAIAARRRDVLEDVARAIETAGGKAFVVPVDVTSPDAVKESVIASERELGSLDLVIANAGVGSPCHAARLTMESVNEVIDVNIRGAFATILAAVPIMILQGQGQIVGISSLAGRIGLPMSGCYGASKAALSTFLETLRIDLAPSGIRITDVQPGYVATPKTDTYTHAMPFIWTAERAARVIATRLERAPSVIAFPWQLTLATSFARLLPSWIYDRVVGSATGG
jgi:NAD(P)-dependent dehydrogenase (short-subunit alcohol dehydrogenase family)